MVVSDYFVVRRAPFVIVIARRGDAVVMLDQYRAATDAIYRSFPAGYLQENETPLQAAARELLEETGFEASSAVLIGVLDPLPGYIESRCYVVTCSADGQIRAVNSDDSEEVRVELLSSAEIEQAISANEIREMQAVAAFTLYSAAMPK
jgi:ADP-ribose pyrophosphatase